jgi:hypothetical protein
LTIIVKDGILTLDFTDTLAIGEKGLGMNTRVVTIQLPEKLYAELQSLADAEKTDPIEVINRLVRTASLHRAWLRDLDALREQIQQEGGLQVGTSKDEVVERLRQTRRTIFEAEYAHLYR